MSALKRALAVAILLSLGACASKTSTRVTNAAVTPLSDFNIVREEIPEVLASAQKATYALPEDLSCGALSIRIHKLDEVLGADLDTPASANQPSLLERGTSAAEDGAIGVVKRTAEGLVPFRSWVRKLSGAERNSRRVAAAITAGSIRRAYLKGVAASQGCTWVSAPQWTATATTAEPAASQPQAAEPRLATAEPQASVVAPQPAPPASSP